MPNDWTATTEDGIALVAHELGGSGRSAVLAHATGFHGTAFVPFARRLAEKFHSIAPDLRGHGRSGAPADLDFNWSGFGLDILAIADGVGTRNPLAGPPVGIGHSLGATALLLAEAGRPGTFSAIYCFEPILVPDELRRREASTHPLGDAARRRRSIFGSRDEARRRYATRPPLDALDAEVLDLYVADGFVDVDDGTVRLRCEPENEGRIFDAGTANDALDRLDSVVCPVMFGCGEDSPPIVAVGIERARERLARARVETISGIGHLGPLEAPAIVAAAVARAFPTL